ncbi:queen brain-selective protein-1 [Nomia melanderi]|uniref:queen brain-selective protein-1 n=1 Tax=Nomia melanderi TaxID=2448451 RepID=UPI001304166C|nr:neuroparsin-A-like [Nomia melanderi]
MSAIQTICVAVLVLVVLAFDKCLGYPSIKVRRERHPLCEPCGETCGDCKFGVKTIPSCGEVCAKGPGETCGGMSNEWGVCGEGMICNCYQCYGCPSDDQDCKEIDLVDRCHPRSKNTELQFPYFMRL